MRQVEDRRLPFEQWPKFLRERPVLMSGLSIFYEAFAELSTCRQGGMGVGPIPYTAIVLYCDQHDFDGDTRELLTDYVRAMDTAFLRYHEQKIESKAGR